MAIIPIPNQPVILEPSAPDDCNLGDRKAYCALYNIGDSLLMQFRHTPCGANLVCDSGFPTGAEILYNNDFSTGVDYLSGGQWNLGHGGYWQYDATNEQMDYYGGGLASVSFIYMIWNPVPGTSYTFEYTVSNYVSGNIKAVLGGTDFATRSSDGTFTETVMAADSSRLYLRPSIDFQGSIDNVSLISVDNTCWAVDTEVTGWSIREGYACHTPGLDGGIAQVDIWSVEAIYQINVTVTGMSAGTLVVDVGGLAPFVITSNGTYTFYREFTFDPAGAFLTFLASTDFDGCISDVTSYGVCDDIEILVTDIDGVELQVQPTFTDVLYVDDYVNLKWTFQEGDQGCYRLQVTDCCRDAVPYLTNCFSVKTEHDCAKLIEGTVDDSELPANKLGFQFNNTFHLAARYRFLKFNPFYPIDQDDYEYSNAVRSITYGKREKFYDGFFDYMDEAALDSVSAMILCNKFTIDGVGYFVKGQDFKPEWDKTGQQQLAQARIELRRTDSTIYNTKCQ